MKKLIKYILMKIRPILNLILLIFYDKEYIKGRHFEINFSGYGYALRSIWIKNILRISPPHKWPTALSCNLLNSKNIFFHPDDLNNFQSPGTYFQNSKGCIHLGRGTYIAPNVGIITANHNAQDLDSHEEGRDVIIGEKCWIGMNSIILPGVILGNGTIVAAGSVVTKSFLEGGILIGGIPAKKIKKYESIPIN